MVKQKNEIQMIGVDRMVGPLRVVVLLFRLHHHVEAARCWCSRIKVEVQISHCTGEIVSYKPRLVHLDNTIKNDLNISNLESNKFTLKHADLGNKTWKIECKCFADN